MTMNRNASGMCTNSSNCFVAEAKEVVRPRRGFNYTCWHCGNALSPIQKQGRAFAGGMGAAAAALVLLDVVKTYGAELTGRF
jgi:hypothetical protein